MTGLVVALALLAVALFAAAWAVARTTGVRARVVASDTGDSQDPTLVDETLRLRGRPDYIVRERAGLVPIEVKPGRRATTLYESDRMQLVAYLLLVRATEPGRFAGYGRVRYARAEFVVTLTAALERRCLDLAARVRAARRAEDVHRTHDLAVKCRSCAVRAACGEALV